MSVHKNFNPRFAGRIIQNAHPNVFPYHWEPTQRNVRANPNIPSQPQRIQPHERGTFYPTSASGGGTLAPQMSSSGACSACSGAASATVASGTATTIATAPSLPSTPNANASNMRRTPGARPRATGTIRSSLPQPRVSPMKNFMGRS